MNASFSRHVLLRAGFRRLSSLDQAPLLRLVCGLRSLHAYLERYLGPAEAVDAKWMLRELRD